jgi:cyclase
MVFHRVIPALLLNNGGLVKTKQFKSPVYVGDPINAIRIFNEKEVDELLLLDIRASIENRGPDFELLGEVASECFMPLAYGGGVATLQQISSLLRLGIEKVILNTALFSNADLVKEAVSNFGSQAIIASIDVRKKLFGKREVFTFSGTKSTGLSPTGAAKYAEDLGVGEILLTSIDNEGTMQGYDIELIAAVSNSVGIPVIASGGAGCTRDFLAAIDEGKASAVSAGSMFVFYGPHRAVLISYPRYKDLMNIFNKVKL